jgi:hypothetical protein
MEGLAQICGIDTRPGIGYQPPPLVVFWRTDMAILGIREREDSPTTLKIGVAANLSQQTPKKERAMSKPTYWRELSR